MKSSPHCLFSLLDLTKGHWTQKYVFFFSYHANLSNKNFSLSL